MGRSEIKTRDLLIKIATQQFIKHGYHSTTIESISKEAGITKASIYHYFSSKDELAGETLKTVHKLNKILLLNIEDPSIIPKTKINQFINQLEALFIERRIELILIFTLNLEELTFIRCIIINIVNEWIESISALLEADHKTTSAKYLSRASFMLIMGALLQSTIDDQLSRVGSDLKRTLKILLLQEA